MNKLNKIIILLASMAIVGMATTSFAGWGRQWSGYCGEPGAGYTQRGYGGPRYWDDMSDEDIAKLSEQRKAFFEETSELRENLYQKELELRAELAKKDPDAQKAVNLQKEISELKGQLDLKRLEHRIKMQKENPEVSASRGFGYGGRGKGYGYGGRDMGRGMGPGFASRGGGCWY